MKKIILERGKGKTTEAIRLANKTGAYLIVRNRERALECAKTTERFPVTYAELMKNKMAGSKVRNIVIDDADDFLQWLLPLKIEAITMSDDETQPA